jgi:hypothetical protein
LRAAKLARLAAFVNFLVTNRIFHDLARNRRKQFAGRMPPEYFEAVQEVVRESFGLAPVGGKEAGE